MLPHPAFKTGATALSNLVVTSLKTSTLALQDFIR